MTQTSANYKGFSIGLAIGVIGMGVFYASKTLRPQGCEPVVDVQYSRNGKDWIPHTVVRTPVRDGARCLLAEAGS
jgi:hypothetical protein